MSVQTFIIISTHIFLDILWDNSIWEYEYGIYGPSPNNQNQHNILRKTFWKDKSKSGKDVSGIFYTTRAEGFIRPFHY